MALDTETFPPRVVSPSKGFVHILPDPCGEDGRAVGADVLEQERLVASGCDMVGDGRQFVDLERDQLERVLGDGRICRYNDRDRLTDIADFVGGDHRLAIGLTFGQAVLADRDQRHIADVRCGDHCHDAVQC